MGSSTSNQSIKVDFTLIPSTLFSITKSPPPQHCSSTTYNSIYLDFFSRENIFLMYLALRQKKKFLMLYDYLHISVLGAFNTSDSLVIRDIIANIGMYIKMEKYYMMIFMKYKYHMKFKMYSIYCLAKLTILKIINKYIVSAFAP